MELGRGDYCQNLDSPIPGLTVVGFFFCFFGGRGVFLAVIFSSSFFFGGEGGVGVSKYQC